MKYRNMLPFVALSVLILTSCDDNKMEWYKDPTHGAVTSSELPLQLAEKISRYKPLKEYLSDPNFKLGIGVGMDEYLGDETTTTIVNEITVYVKNIASDAFNFPGMCFLCKKNLSCRLSNGKPETYFTQRSRPSIGGVDSYCIQGTKR